MIRKRELPGIVFPSWSLGTRNRYNPVPVQDAANPNGCCRGEYRHKNILFFSANLCVLKRLCGYERKDCNRRGAEYAEIRREEKKSKSEPQHTSAQRFGCGLGHAKYSVDTLFLFGFGSDSNIRAVVSIVAKELHNGRRCGAFQGRGALSQYRLVPKWEIIAPRPHGPRRENPHHQRPQGDEKGREIL